MTADIEPHWDRSALLTIDVQRDFLSDGAAAVAGTTEVLPAMGRLREAFRVARRPIVHVVRLYLADGSNADLCRRATIAAGAVIAQPGTPGAQLAAEITPPNTTLDADLLLRGDLQQVGPEEHVVFKPRWNAFFATSLDMWLRGRGVDTVVVAGCNFPNCPRGTVFGASERDYRAVAVADATSRFPVTATDELTAIGVSVHTTSEVVHALRGSELRST